MAEPPLKLNYSDGKEPSHEVPVWAGAVVVVVVFASMIFGVVIAVKWLYLALTKMF